MRKSNTEQKSKAIFDKPNHITSLEQQKAEISFRFAAPASLDFDYLLLGATAH